MTAPRHTIEKERYQIVYVLFFLPRQLLSVQTPKKVSDYHTLPLLLLVTINIYAIGHRTVDTPVPMQTLKLGAVWLC